MSFSKESLKILIVRFCYFAIALIILSLFIENFVFSESLGILGFREIDDVAFQSTLRSIHAGGRYLSINDYAYGWIFWAPMALITYPFYFLSKYFSIDWPLIVIPRQISLALATASLFYLRKIFILKKTPEYVCALVLLAFTLFPTFGYFSLRFGTVNAVMFFSLLTFYLALKDEPSTELGRKKIMISLAIAGGIKLSGLLIAPIIFAVVLINYPFADLKKSGKIIMKSILFFGFFLIVFTNPRLLESPFHIGIARDYLDTLKHFVGVTKLSSDTMSPLERFYYGAFGNGLNLWAMIILYFGILIYDTKSKADIFFKYTLLLGLVTIAAVLMFSIKNGLSLGSYFTSVSFLLLLGVLGLNSSKIRLLGLVLVVVLLMYNLESRTYASYYGTADQWNHFNYYVKFKNSKKDLENADLINKCIGLENAPNGLKHIFIDFTIKSKISVLKNSQICLSVAWDNFSETNKYCPIPVDYLILNTKSVGFLAQADFDLKVAQVDAKVAENYKIDRRTRENLTLNGEFDSQTYKLACQYDEVKVYKRSE